MPHGLLYGASFTKGTLSFTDKQGRTICKADLWDFLTLTATSDNSSVRLTRVGALSNKFEVNVGNGWTAYELGTVRNLNAGQSCKWRCSARPTMQSTSSYVQFVMTGTIEASGNCNSMLSSYFENLTSLSENDYAFYKLFRDCTSLTKAPILPATTLSPGCYSSMFSGCNSLKEAPSLPATILQRQCYSSMFFGCNSLKEAPSLPATAISPECYYDMFWGCTALTQAPSLPAMELSKSCYENMFRGCTALTQAPSLPAMELEESCYESMFRDCVSLTQAPSALPAIVAKPRCYFSMFEGCTSLINAPMIAATTCRISSDKYNNAHLSYMFRNCTALANPPEIHLTTLAYHALYFMFMGCTSLIRAPHLPAMTLAEGCYYGIFNGCTSLTEVRIDATTTATDALRNWLADVSPTGEFYCDPNATIFPTGASGIPEGWTRLPLSDYPTT